MTPTAIQQAVTLIQSERQAGRKHFNLVFNDGTKKKVRLFIYNGNEICQYLNGSKSHGNYLDTSRVVDILPIMPRHKDENIRFIKNCDKVIKLLKESGWWGDILHDVEFLRASGLEKCAQWEKDYWCFDIPYDQKEERKRRQASVPEQFSASSFGLVHNLKIEKMYFGLNSDYHLRDIAKSVKDNVPVCFRLDADKWNKLSYDTSFEFNPEKKKAWYSKEYRNCGNGHYYIALNPTHAAYYEDD